ncbi:DUF1636 family protein [Rubellimicrobium arenae]|uniref:DUF1636 family protein n=1 Tax=Rubellimicrobium arenae TaxID=2817372 RepID=UPI001B302AC0|nr:DUF1636 domain-containing protein [Rubellimicrobium arenae]
MASWITICDTCKREGWPGPAEGAAPPGASLAELVETAAEGTALRTRRTACLMGCDHGCNVAVQAKGKLSYTLGRFEPTAEAAEAIVAWARLHAESASGQVPYKLWPQGVKGHFVTRHPPLPEEA